MAGEPMTMRCQRAITVSPNELHNEEFVAPMHEEVGEPENEDKNEEEAVETNNSEDVKE